MLADAPGLLERILRRDRLIVAGSLLLVALLAWVYLLRMSVGMPGMSLALPDLAAMPLQPWDVSYFSMILLMWAVMMVGMMLPSAAPAILIFTSLVRRSPDTTDPVLRTWLFVTGYLFAWFAFSLAATTLQWAMETLALRVAAIRDNGSVLGGCLLIVAGVYQWSPLKQACLRQCRSPLELFSRRWRQKPSGAVRMGIEHGLYCLGCCWVLMGILFVGGVMNLLLIAVITIFVLMEKLVQRGAQAGRLIGVALVFAGIWLAIAR